MTEIFKITINHPDQHIASLAAVAIGRYGPDAIYFLPKLVFLAEHAKGDLQQAGRWACLQIAGLGSPITLAKPDLSLGALPTGYQEPPRRRPGKPDLEVSHLYLMSIDRPKHLLLLLSAYLRSDVLSQQSLRLLNKLDPDKSSFFEIAHLVRTFRPLGCLRT